MAYQIIESKCTGCGTCADGCPEDAIEYAPSDGIYRIKPEACIDCGECETSCPNAATRPLV